MSVKVAAEARHLEEGLADDLVNVPDGDLGLQLGLIPWPAARSHTLACS